MKPKQTKMKGKLRSIRDKPDSEWDQISTQKPGLH